MDFKHLLTSFDGRIGRKQFWIGILGLIVASIVLIIVLGVTIGLFLSDAVVSLVGNLILLYPAAALMTKRLHDRNKPQSPWLYIFLAPSLLTSFMTALGIGFVTVTVEGAVATVPTGSLGYLLVTATGVVGIWALIELGFLRGTEGTNDFGDDPTT